MRRIDRRRTTVSSGSESGFWPSYADMMSAVALILFFLMLLSYIQNLITGNTLKDTQDVLDQVELQLTDTQEELGLTMEELSTTMDELNSTQEQLLTSREELDDLKSALTVKLQEIDDAEKKLSKVTADLDTANRTLAQKQQEISAQGTALKDQEALIALQQADLKAANEELDEMRGQMQSIAVLRLSILEQIRDSLVEVTGSRDKVKIGENGSIILSEGILFDVGSSEIKEQAEPTLNELISVLYKFLGQKDSVRYVDSIVISGHTDSTGTDASNRLLSTDRANAVLNYLMTGKNGQLGRYAQYFCSAGYGESRPVASNDTEAGKSANRRIEISITLKDDSILEIVDNYLQKDTAKVS